MKIYHLSHTDLDGYGCQFVSKHYFKDCEFFNSNYGKEIEEKFYEILDKLDEDKEQKALVLISDVNPTVSFCDEMDEKIKAYKNVKILLLDHHQTGEECMQKHPWYLLDSSRCATKITYDFFSKIFGKNEELELLVDIINSIDIWQSDSKYFELGKILMQIIASSKEINRIMFARQNLEYKFFLIKESMRFFKLANAHIELENATHFLKKDFFKSGDDDTLCNLISKYTVKNLSENKDIYTIFYKGKKGILASDIGNVSVVGNDFLLQNPDYHFFLEVSPNRKISLRANNQIDVSKMAQEVFSGGGHANASGGIFASYKDSSVYKKILEQTKAHLEKYNEK